MLAAFDSYFMIFSSVPVLWPCMLKGSWCLTEEKLLCCSRCSFQAFEWFYPFLSLSVTQPTKCRWGIQQSRAAGGWQQVCGLSGNRKTLKHCIPERSLTREQLGKALEFWVSNTFVKEMKCLGKVPANKVTSALTGRSTSSSKAGAGHLQLELVFHHLQHF